MSKDKPSSTKYACRKDKYILTEDEKRCPICGGSDLSDEWSGIVIIMDPSSKLAEIIGAKKTGRYAIKVR
ncbi:MAG: DNA-directed RNA polymerase, subunit E'' [Candidatus Verstraetearchaeota archaeon]|nr:DNA-directed RNA polymerase, subunit E'' [Candidatus Verstraetearchaeota archaeon]